MDIIKLILKLHAKKTPTSKKSNWRGWSPRKAGLKLIGRYE